MSHIHEQTRIASSLRLLMQVAQQSTDHLVKTPRRAIEVLSWRDLDKERAKIFHVLTGNKACRQLGTKHLLREYMHRMKIDGNSFEERLRRFDEVACEIIQTDAQPS